MLQRWLFPGKSVGFIRLFLVKRVVQGLAAALMSIFLPVYIYTAAGEQFWPVGIFYAVASLLYAALLPFGMLVTNYVGFSRILIVGGLFATLQYTLLYYSTEETLLSLLPLILLAFIAFRLFHWVPFHVDFTLFTQNGRRGSDVSLTFAAVALMGVIGPVLAGTIVSYSDFDTLFAVVIGLYLVASVSYWVVPEVSAQFEWTWRETFRNFFSKKMRALTAGAFANGMESVVTLVVWPVFLYEVLAGDLLDVGLISTLIVALTLILQFFVGKHIDQSRQHAQRTLRTGSLFYAAGWVAKIFVLSATQVFFVGLYHNVTKIFTKTPLTAILYDISGEQGEYVDEVTVVREIAMHLGRALAIALVVVVSLYVPIQYTFVIAAVASLAFNLIYRLES